jgi:hypothetical protein
MELYATSTRRTFTEQRDVCQLQSQESAALHHGTVLHGREDWPTGLFVFTQILRIPLEKRTTLEKVSLE